MEKTLDIARLAKGAALTLLWAVALFMIFCEGSATTSLTDEMIVKACGVGLAWLLIKITGIR